MPIQGPPLEQPVRLAEILKIGLDTKPDDDALVSAAKRLTWRALNQASDRLAGNYLAYGLKPGDRLASLMPNRADLVVHYLACFKAGLVTTPLNYRYMAPEIDHALGVSEAAALLAHEERTEDLAKSALAGTLPLGVIGYSDDGASAGPSFAELVAAEPPSRPEPPGDSAPGAIFFTSGSTGKPKGVTQSRFALAWQFASIADSLTLGTDDVVLPAGSLSHTGAFRMTFAALMAGARATETRSLAPGDELAFIRAERPTILIVLPTALFKLIRSPGARDSDLASLRFCGCGGDKVSPQLDQEFTALTGFPVNEGYGMSETGTTLFNNPRRGRKLNSLGQVTAGYTAALRDDDGKEVPTGEQGRLWIQSPGILSGYWNRPDATAEAMVDGWFDTGDVMRRDEDDFFWFCGRQKQIIVHDGSNICPQEVEGALLEHPAVEAAGVVGVHDLLHGEDVRAFVTLSGAAEAPSEVELIRFARERVGYKAPEEIVFLDEMPLNATGKLDRVTLKALAAGDHAHVV